MLGEYAWYTENSDSKTQPVAKKKANAFGLYDMHGNVWEWVEDCYKSSYEGMPTDGSATKETSGCARVVRGGSWFNTPVNLRAANRDWIVPVYRIINLGFRVGRLVVPPRTL